MVQLPLDELRYFAPFWGRVSRLETRCLEEVVVYLLKRCHYMSHLF